MKARVKDGGGAISNIYLGLYSRRAADALNWLVGKMGRYYDSREWKDFPTGQNSIFTCVPMAGACWRTLDGEIMLTVGMGFSPLATLVSEAKRLVLSNGFSMNIDEEKSITELRIRLHQDADAIVTEIERQLNGESDDWPEEMEDIVGEPLDQIKTSALGILFDEWYKKWPNDQITEQIRTILDIDVQFNNNLVNLQ